MDIDKEMKKRGLRLFLGIALKETVERLWQKEILNKRCVRVKDADEFFKRYRAYFVNVEKEQ